MKWYIHLSHPLSIVGIDKIEAVWINFSLHMVTYYGKTYVAKMLGFLLLGWKHIQSDLAFDTDQICPAHGWYLMPSFAHSMELAKKLELTQYASNLGTIQELTLNEHVASQCPEVPINVASVMKFLGHPVIDCYFTSNGAYIETPMNTYCYSQGILTKNTHPVPYLISAVDYPGVSRPVYIIQPKNEPLSRKHLYM